MDACLAFCADVLGLAHEESNGRHALRFGDQKLNLPTRPAEFLPAAERHTPGGLDLCLRMRGELSESKRKIEAMGYPIEHGPVARHGALGEMQGLYLRDPDGNLIELCSHEP